MKQLKISDTFSLPLEAVTETFLDLGQRGSGKSNSAAVIAEELFAHGAPFAVLTPVDVWWGLKSSADGSGPGLPIYIFGGAHADLPLAPTAGRLMADVLIEQRISCVMCTQGFSGKERAQFVTEFAERLLDKNREPLHLIVEEADAFIPQKPYPGEERMLGAMDRLIRWGRSPSAIGGTFISQRSAKINKDITTQCSVLLAHRTTGPQDIEAIREWFKYHQEPERMRQVLSEISSLPKGQAFIYSPAWLEHFGKCQIRRRRTFDSAATPKLGAKAISVKTATVDLKVLESKMAETIEKAKADDPAELRRKVRSLEAQVKALENVRSTAAEVDRLKQEFHLEREKFADEISRLRGRLSNSADIAQKIKALTADHFRAVEYQLGQLVEPEAMIQPLIDIYGAARKLAGESVTRAIKKVAREQASEIKPELADAFIAHRNESVLDTMPGGELKVLTAIAQYPDGVSRIQLSILTGYKKSTRDLYLQKLQQKHLVMVRDGRLCATAAGLNRLGTNFEPLPTGQALIDYWCRTLPGGEKNVFSLLVNHRGRPVDRQLVSQQTGYLKSTRDLYIQKLAARQLVINHGRGMVGAAPFLFE